MMEDLLKLMLGLGPLLVIIIIIQGIQLQEKAKEIKRLKRKNHIDRQVNNQIKSQL